MSCSSYRIVTNQKLDIEILDFSLDYSDQFEAGEEISTSLWTVPDGIVEAFADGATTTVTTVWLSGGTKLAQYRLINTVTTNQSRTYACYLIVDVC